jgi:hypothetical protein
LFPLRAQDSDAINQLDIALQTRLHYEMQIRRERYDKKIRRDERLRNSEREATFRLKEVSVIAHLKTLCSSYLLTMVH